MNKLLLLLFLSASFTAAQSQSVLFYQSLSIGHGAFTGAVVCDTTASGNYLVVGGSGGIMGSNYLYGVLDQNGNVIWEKDSTVYGPLDFHDASFYNGRRTLDNGFIFCGSLTNYGVSNENGIFILKTDSSGNELWRKNISQFQRGEATDIYLESDSSLFFTGYVRDSITSIYSNYILKLSSTGDSLFMQEYSMPGSYAENLFKIDDTFFITGTVSLYDSLTQNYRYGVYFLSTDTLGNYLSSHTIFDSVLSINPHSFWKMNDDHILITCAVTDTTSQGNIQLFKVDTSANIIWADTIVNLSYFTSYACELANGNILVGYGNNQIQKRNSAGDTIWTRDFTDTSYHGSAYTEATSIFPLNNSTFLVSASRSVSAPGGSWPFITKISDSTLTAIGEIEKTDFSIYPNPTTNTITIKILSSNKKRLLQIFNPVGQIVYTEKIFGKDELKVDVNFASGIYFVSIGDGERNVVKKLIVE